MNSLDIIIIGSGMAGLYSAYHIKKVAPHTKFIILEKYKKQWIGGRTSNEMFYGTEIVTGAGIGRKDTNPLLIQLMTELHIPFTEFHSVMNYSFKPVDIMNVINKLRIEYKKHPGLRHKTFKQFFIQTLGLPLYKQFLISAGYTDYEHADVYETLYNYGMDDNQGGWTGLNIPWKKIVQALYHKIGEKHFRFHSNVKEIKKIQNTHCLFEVKTEDNKVYLTNKVIVATTISSLQKLFPNHSKLYQQIHGQPFLRLYAKFDKQSSEIMKLYVPYYTIVPGPLQKLIPMNADKGVYMIAYSDNKNAQELNPFLENTPANRQFYEKLVEQALGIEHVHILAIKDYYWPIGTHYYEPLKKDGDFTNRNEFVYHAQHPEKGILVVGEAVSRYQGWTEGALESVKSVLTNSWIQKPC